MLQPLSNMKKAIVKEIHFNGEIQETYIQVPKFVEVTEDYRDLAGELVAEKGAIGILAGCDRGRVTISFLNNGKYVRPGYNNELIQDVLVANVKIIDTPKGVVIKNKTI